SGIYLRTLQDDPSRTKTDAASASPKYDINTLFTLITFRFFIFLLLRNHRHPKFMKLIELFSKYQSQSTDDGLTIDHIFVYIFPKTPDSQLAIGCDQIFYVDIANDWIILLWIGISTLDINLTTYMNDQSFIEKAFSSSDIKFCPVLWIISTVICVTIQSKVQFKSRIAQ